MSTLFALLIAYDSILVANLLQLEYYGVYALRTYSNHTTMTILYPVLAGILVMLASVAGVLFSWRVFGTWLPARLRYLVALAAGVFVVVIYGLVEEVLHEGVHLEALLAFLAGGVLLEAVTRLLPHNTHHHHGPASDHHHSHLDARRLLIGDAIHNMHDGLVLVPAFLVSPAVGFGTTFGVLLHELVQEIAEFFVLREAGYSVRKALLLNLAASATIMFGIAGSLYAVSFEEIAHLLVPFSAGGFTYILLRDLVPSIVRHSKSEGTAIPYLLSFVAGAVLMFVVTLAVPHEHEEYDEELPLPDGFGLAYESPNVEPCYS